MIQVFKYLPDSGRPFLINFIPAQNQIVIQGWTFSESRQAFKLVNHILFFFFWISWTAFALYGRSNKDSANLSLGRLTF